MFATTRPQPAHVGPGALSWDSMKGRRSRHQVRMASEPWRERTHLLGGERLLRARPSPLWLAWWRRQALASEPVFSSMKREKVRTMALGWEGVGVGGKAHTREEENEGGGLPGVRFLLLLGSGARQGL